MPSTFRSNYDVILLIEIYPDGIATFKFNRQVKMCKYNKMSAHKYTAATIGAQLVYQIFITTT